MKEQLDLIEEATQQALEQDREEQQTFEQQTIEQRARNSKVNEMLEETFGDAGLIEQDSEEESPKVWIPTFDPAMLEDNISIPVHTFCDQPGSENAASVISFGGNGTDPLKIIEWVKSIASNDDETDSEPGLEDWFARKVEFECPAPRTLSIFD